MFPVASQCERSMSIKGNMLSFKSQRTTTHHKVHTRTSPHGLSVYFSMLIGLVLASLFSATVCVFAVPPDTLYSPGETTDPGCTPGSPNCSVTAPIGLNSSGGFDASVGTILFNTDIYQTEGVTYQHPRDPSELNGNSNYSYYAIQGMYEQMSASTSVSAIRANVWCTNTSRDVVLKLFARPNTTAFNPDTATPLYSGTISHTNMPHASVSGGSLFTLTTPVTVPAGSYLYVLWESTTANEIAMSYFNADASSAPYRNRMVLGNTNATFGYSGGSSYYAATFRLYGATNLTRQTTQGPGPELLSNTGFETWPSGLPTGWLAGAGTPAGIALETTIVHSGSNAVKMVTGTPPTGYSPNINVANLSVTPGSTYIISFWTRGDGTNAGGYGIYDRSHSQYSVSLGTTTTVAGTSYQQVTIQWTAPAGCTAIDFFLTSKLSTAGATAYFDDVSFKQVVTTTTSIPIGLQTLLNSLPGSAISFLDSNGFMTSTNVQSAIIEAYNHGSDTSSIVSPRIVLPDTLYAVAGDELQLFVRGMIEAQNPYNLPYVINSTVGTSYPRYFDYTPVVADVGTKTLTVKVLDYNYSVLTTKSVSLKVVNPTGEPSSNKNILVVGDSLTGGGTWPAELYRRLTQTGGSPAGLGYSNITFIGDQSLPGYATQAYTGYGGWSYALYNGTSGTTSGHVLTGTFDKDKTDVSSTYTDGTNTWAVEYATGGLKVHGAGTLASSGTLTWVSGGTHHGDIVYTARTNEPESPFWNSSSGTLSFSNWVARNGYSGIDAVYVLLGWNSTGGANVSDYSSYMADVRAFLNQLHADYPSAIVRIVGIQMPSANGGLGANYGANGGPSEYYGMVRSANSMNIAYQNLANEASYNSWVRFISIAPQFDSENNLPQSLAPVNTRNSTTEYRGTNGVHPSTQGYYQISDAVYREFINTFCSN